MKFNEAVKYHNVLMWNTCLQKNIYSHYQCVHNTINKYMYKQIKLIKILQRKIADIDGLYSKQNFMIFNKQRETALNQNVKKFDFISVVSEIIMDKQLGPSKREIF